MPVTVPLLCKDYALNAKNSALRPSTLLLVFTAVTLAVVIIPFKPAFYPPNPGLESFVLAMGEALAHGMVIGRDLIFTYGPYASLSTRFYHPHTDLLVCMASAYLALTHVLIFKALSRQFSLGAVLGIVLFILLIKVGDFFFLFYPFLTTLYAVTLVAPRPVSDKWQLLELGLVFAALGLMPLVKGSYLLSVLVILPALAYLFYRRGNYAFLTVILIAPIIGLLSFWVFTGQALSLLPIFFVNILPIVAGYTEAMALNLYPLYEVLLFVLVALLIMGLWLLNQRYRGAEKIVLALALAVFLFVSFKAGFVRHDDHVYMALQGLVGASLCLYVLIPGNSALAVLAVALLSYVGIVKSHATVGTLEAFSGLSTEVQTTYKDAWQGLSLRVSNPQALAQIHAASMAEIAKNNPLPKLPGTSDIFSYNQAELFAAGLTWNPRPVFQSYSVYTQRLAELNAQHFRTPHAPDHVIFRMQAIDSRLPSLEDGAAWMALSDNYFPAAIQENAVFLSKKTVLQSKADTALLSSAEHQLGERVTLPQQDAPIYAEITLQPSLLGKLFALFYKPSQLWLTLNLANGDQRQYRVLSNMMQSSFLLSPLVDNIRAFTFVATGKQQAIQNLQVTSMQLTAKEGPSFIWQPTYTLKLLTYNKTGQDELPEGLFSNPLQPMPKDLTLAKFDQCDGFIDSYFGFSPTTASVNRVGIIGLEGWMAKSAQSGQGVDNLFVVLSQPGGESYFTAVKRSARADVKAFFKHPQMQDLGYQVVTDVRALHGNYLLKLAFSSAGKFYECANTQFAVEIKP